MPSRQQPGLACEECRSRKLRCDREKPRCGVCRNLDVQCSVNTAREPRGPKKGRMKDLQSRIMMLEQRLGEESGEQQNEQQAAQQEEHRIEQLSQEYSENQLGQSSVVVPGFSTANHTPPTNITPPPEQIDLDPQPLVWPMNWEDTPELIEPLDATSQLQAPQGGHINHAGNFGTDSSQYTDKFEFYRLLEQSRVPQVLSLTTPPSEQEVPEGFFTPALSDTSVSSEISDLVRADLDQLYFDRVHITAPIIHQRKYFSRTQQSSNTITPSACLQTSMWALAATVSSQFQHMGHSLYRKAKTMLETLELQCLGESVPIEEAQAWTLLAVYEVKQISSQRAWVCLGRCLRLVQFMKLHEVDIPNPNPNSNGLAGQKSQNWADMEEQRRVFWMAYLLDRCVSLLTGSPMTINEQMILTRLPAPERHFQSDNPVGMDFLSEAMASSNTQNRSSFLESLVQVTIYGRSLSHRQQCMVEQVYGNNCQDCWNRHERLDSSLCQGVNISTHMPTHMQATHMEWTDPILIFADMAAQATVLCLFETLQSMTCGIEKHQTIANRYENRAMIAAQNITNLSKSITHLSYFKIHPFTPIPLFFCAKFLLSRKHLYASFQAQSVQVLGALRSLCALNTLAQSCISKLEKENNLL